VLRCCCSQWWWTRTAASVSCDYDDDNDTCSDEGARTRVHLTRACQHTICDNNNSDARDVCKNERAHTCTLSTLTALTLLSRLFSELCMALCAACLLLLTGDNPAVVKIGCKPSLGYAGCYMCFTRATRPGTRIVWKMSGASPMNVHLTRRKIQLRSCFCPLCHRKPSDHENYGPVWRQSECIAEEISSGGHDNTVDSLELDDYCCASYRIAAAHEYVEHLTRSNEPMDGVSIEYMEKEADSLDALEAMYHCKGVTCLT